MFVGRAAASVVGKLKKTPKRNIICSSNNKRNRFTMSNMHARQLPLSLSICKGVNYLSLCVCVRVDRRLTASHLSMESDDLDSTRLASNTTLWIA